MENDFDLKECFDGYNKMVSQRGNLSTILPFLKSQPELFFDILTLIYWGHEWNTLNYFLQFEFFHGLNLGTLSEEAPKIKNLLFRYSLAQFTYVTCLTYDV